MIKGILISIFAFALTANAHVKTEKLCGGFMPPNNMYIPDDHSPASAITKASFDSVLDQIQAVYEPIVAANGGRLRIDRKWNDGTVNAYADRSGRNWFIHMFGGMARHKAVTADAFAAVACHELGHHLGGAPRFSSGDWASVEGESDYFAFTKCLRRVWEADDNKKIVDGMTVDPVAVQKCHDNHSSQQDEYVCIRATMANLALGLVLVEDTGRPDPKLDTPDPKIVTQTFTDHPEAQCRVDTMFHGSLCTVPFNQDLGQTDYRVGACTDYSKDGPRRRCWFKPN